MGHCVVKGGWYLYYDIPLKLQEETFSKRCFINSELIKKKIDTFPGTKVKADLSSHCLLSLYSPGTGRTGTLLSSDIVMKQFEEHRTIDVPRTVYAIRRDRAGAVQTKEQYAFIYRVCTYIVWLLLVATSMGQ